MAYKDDRSDSLQLIPNGVGFDDSTPQMSVEQLAEIFQGRISREDTEKLNLLFQKEASDEAIEEILKGFRDLLNNERKQLLRLCGYTVRTDSEAQNILYLKPLFILQNSKWFYSEFPASKYQSIVNILLSDPCVLFTDADEHFRHSRINNEAISAWNPLFYDTKKRRDYCNMHADNISKQFQEKDMPLYKTMLDKISKSAVKKHQNIQDWIRKHIPYDESDIDKNLVQLKEVFPEYADQITPNFSENFFYWHCQDMQIRLLCFQMMSSVQTVSLLLWIKKRLSCLYTIRLACEDLRICKVRPVNRKNPLSQLGLF